MLGPAHLQCIVPMGREANAWPIGSPWRTTPGRILLGNRGPRYTPKRIALRCLGPPICSALFPWDARRTLGRSEPLGGRRQGESYWEIEAPGTPLKGLLCDAWARPSAVHCSHGTRGERLANGPTSARRRQAKVSRCKETVWHPHCAHKVSKSSVYGLGTYMTESIALTAIGHPRQNPRQMPHSAH